jgi:hydroxyacylglutathione hydrolase
LETVGLVSLQILFAAFRRDPGIRAVYTLPPQKPPSSLAYCLAGSALTQVALIPNQTYSMSTTRYNGFMIHEIFPVGPLQCNCSIIGDETSREAIVIDPGDDIENVLALIRKHNLQVKQIVVTHGHIDHVGGAMKLRAATGAPILLNQNDHDLLKILDVQAAWLGMAPPGEVKVDQNLSNGDTVKAGSHTANVLYTPGHTEGSICLYFPTEKILIAGDTLFAGSIGRTDLPGGSMQKIMQSLHGTVLALPDDTTVVPGHGPLTSIGEERESNPFLVKR